ncbi:leucine-rich repeat-containing G-protein coupled receptor 5-like isoform X2 [Homarus americanus]|uniref:leucine-rich repeat-containing G-protein coupled receptor 5-like isoform X2 n=1 Tax=Homarus americanus TaxID=6706 RepID=UPI001C494243|nr:leucine-rich repeat-containing G-protein coupled receptor 5-like isoform X2 [Homarus americanus]
MRDSGDAGGPAGGGRGSLAPLLLPLCLLLLLLAPAVSACPTACTCEAVPPRRSSALSRRSVWAAKTEVPAAHNTNNVTLVCRDAGLMAPPDLVALNGLDPATVSKMDLSKNGITELHEYSFSLYPSLHTLKVCGNRLTTIAAGAFQDIPLRVLVLDNNKLSELVADSLPASLREISLERNTFTSIPPSLTALHGLQFLNLARNRLTALKDGDLRGLHNLQRLSLHQNRISTVESRALAPLRNLEKLDLEVNTLTEVPTAVTRCLKLKELLLGSNRLTYVGEDSFKGLARLQDVALWPNQLLTIHQRAFSNLPSLTKLILKEMKQLQEFPDLNGTSSLELIRIDRAALTAVPENLCSVAPKLRSLNLQRNSISEMPDLNRCRQLRLIDLSHNNISSLPAATFSSLSFLQDLLLQGNRVHTIHNNTFNGLEKLQVLQLEDNLITSIHQDAFLPLVSLEDINLGNNSFPELPAQGLEHVVSIKVHNNRHLRVFPGPESFPMVRALTLSYAYHCCPFLRLEDHTEAPQIIEEVIYSGDGFKGLDPTIWNVSSVWPETGLRTNFAAIWANLAADFPPANTDLVDTTSLDLGEATAATHTLPLLPRHQVLCNPEPGPFMPCEDLFDWWTLRCGVWIVFLLALLGNGAVVVVLVFARAKMDVPRFLVTNLAFADFFMGLYLGFLAVVDASTLGEFRMYAIPWQTSVGCQVAGFLGVLSCELSVYTLTVITMERNYAITHAMHLNKRLSLRHAAYIMVLGWLFACTMALLPLIGVSDYRKFAVCLPIETKGAGLGYVVFLMFINGVAFLILMGCYLKIYCAIRGSQAWNSNDSRIAKRMALLVFTDFICWAPIAFFSLTAAFGLQLISLKEAKVFTVFILPFNSCCNPFLYALLTKQFKKDCVMLCKTIEESRVTRGIGRCRHSSNFSNRQTPANTNSALENSSRQDNQLCRCQNKTQESQKLHHRLRISALKYLFCHKDTEGLNSTSDFSYQPTKSAVKSKRHTSVSSETYSSSWSDTWRRGHAAMSLRILDRRHHNSWYLSRKPSQESNLSSSRNDSSATTASTSTWRISRSSVSSDISSSGSRGVGKSDVAPTLRLGSLRERRGECHIQIPTRQITHHHQALLVRQQSGASGQRSAPITSAVRIKPRLQRQSAIERETYIPNKAAGGQNEITCPLHQRSDNLSCVYEQESYEEEDHEASKDYLNPRCPMAGLTVTFIPRKLSTISSHSVSVVRDAEGDEPAVGPCVDVHSSSDPFPMSNCDFSRGGKCVSLTLLPQSSSQTSPSRFPSDGHLPRSPRCTELLYFTNLAAPALIVPSTEQNAESPPKDLDATPKNHYGQAILIHSQPRSPQSLEHDECMESTALMDDDCYGDDEVFEEENKSRERPLETHFPLDDPPGETRPLI